MLILAIYCNQFIHKISLQAQRHNCSAWHNLVLATILYFSLLMHSCFPSKFNLNRCNDLEQALPSVYTLQCLTGKVDNNNNISLLRWPRQSWLRAWRLAGIWVACGSSHDGVGFFFSPSRCLSRFTLGYLAQRFSLRPRLRLLGYGQTPRTGSAFCVATPSSAQLVK